jgi:hypothetical protein
MHNPPCVQVAHVCPVIAEQLQLRVLLHRCSRTRQQEESEQARGGAVLPATY